MLFNYITIYYYSISSYTIILLYFGCIGILVNFLNTQIASFATMSIWDREIKSAFILFPIQHVTASIES